MKFSLILPFATLLMPEVAWMDPISMLGYLRQMPLDIAIAKDSSPRMCLLSPTSAPSLFMFFLAGKEVRQMLASTTQLRGEACHCPMGAIFWLMQDFQTVTCPRVCSNFICETMYLLLILTLFCFRPADYKELYNLRHAQARNVVERAFGVFKRRFAITEAAPEYPIELQAKLVNALCVLHNFILIHDPTDISIETWTEHRARGSWSGTDDYIEVTPNVPVGDITEAERRRASERRDRLAKRMWEDYRREGLERGL
jgi:hypothetical protein